MQKTSIIFRTAGLATLWFALACGSSAKIPGGGSAVSAPQQQQVVAKSATAVPAPKTLFTLSYVAGPNWKKGKPPQDQDLSGHFAYVGKLFKQGKLVANGLYGDEIRGLYALAVSSEADARAVSTQDPGVKNGVIALESIGQWMIMFDGFAATHPKDQSFFVLEYAGGSAWVADRSPMEQDLKGHFDYVGSKLAQGTLIAAGHVLETNHGRYIIAAPSQAQADAFVAADPGVQSQVLKVVSARPWMPLQRQSVAAALESQGVANGHKPNQ
jgi:uncharacterized protein YciI